MKILIAPDSFKECLTAQKVVTHIANGITEVIPEATLFKMPMSDGGEGILSVFIEKLGGTYVTLPVKDPLLRNVNAKYGILPDASTAVIEMAQASGLELLKPRQRNPLITSTYGTGQLIVDALDNGCKKIIIGLGGSATNDGGMGMLKALGCQFLDIEGKDIGEGGGQLHLLHTINLSQLDSRIQQTEIVVACDVDNPLTGVNGASFVFGPQKGASYTDVHTLDFNLKHYAKILAATLPSDFSTTPGTGAAGGLGMALLAVLNGSLVSGVSLVMEALQIEALISESDLIITGEGKIDQQTVHGKTIAGIAALGKKHQVPVVVITGKIENGFQKLYDNGVTSVHSIVNAPMNLEGAITSAPYLIESAVSNIIRTIQPFKIKL